MSQNLPNPYPHSAGPNSEPAPEPYRDLRGPRRMFNWLVGGLLTFELAGVLAIWHQVGSLSALEIGAAIVFGISVPVFALGYLFDAYVNRHPVFAAISNGRLVVQFPPTRLYRSMYEVALEDIALVESRLLTGNRPRMAIAIHSAKLPLRGVTLELSSDDLIHDLQSLSPNLPWKAYP